MKDFTLTSQTAGLLPLLSSDSSSQVAAIADLWQFWLDALMNVTSVVAPLGLSKAAFPCGESPIGRAFMDVAGVERNVASVIELNSCFRSQTKFSNLRFSRMENSAEKVALISGVPQWNDKGDFDGFRCTAMDVSNALVNTSEINDYEVILSAFVRHVPNLIVVKDVEGRFMAANPLAERTYGIPRGKLIGQRAQEILPANILAEDSKRDDVVLETESVQEFEQTFPAPTGARTFHTVKFPIFDADRYLVGVGSIGVDVTDYKTTEKGLYQKANFDGVTGLPNRHMMMDRLDQALAFARRGNNMVGVIMLDMGDFTGLNAAMGNIIGDWLLIDVAATLKAMFRESDTVCRLENDMFAIMLPNINSGEELDFLADKVLKSLQEARILGEEEVFIQPSIGAALSPVDAHGSAELVQCAKMALDLAKESGRGRYARFKQAISGAFIRRMKLESNLRHAIERHELSLAYQPIVDVKSGEVTGAEALLRWKNEDLGFVSPAEFIPVAEDTGLICEMGHWVIRQACADAKTMNPEGSKPTVISVNVSVKQLAEANIVAKVEAALKDFDLSPNLLKIEMTESAFADDKHAFQAAVEGFRNLGITVALDDFGTGYSSLSYLHRYRFHQLKIDKSFVDNIAARGDGYLLVENIIRMAHGLRLEVVAEGVETQDQLEMLKEMGCDKFQGYLCSKPLPFENFQNLAARISAELVDAL